MVVDGVGEYSMQVLKEAVTMERARGVFEDFSSEPVVVHSPRSAAMHDLDEIYPIHYLRSLVFPPKKPKWK